MSSGFPCDKGASAPPWEVSDLGDPPARRYRGGLVTALKARIKEFWLAEELPRWFGLSLVILYFGSLWGVHVLSIRQAEEAQRQEALRRSAEFLAFAADRCADLAPLEEARWRKILHDVGSIDGFMALRAVDESGVVRASLNSDEVGQAAALPIEWLGSAPTIRQLDESASDAGGRVRWLQAPFSAPGGGEGVWSLVAQTGLPPILFLDRISFFRPLYVVLLAAGGLYLIYHGARSQMRTKNAIAQRIRRNAEKLDESLHELRLVDERDELASLWNRWVALIEQLRLEVRRSEAAEELHRVLTHSAGGRLSEALETLPDGLMHLSGEGTVEYSNARARGLFKLPAPGEDKPTTLAEAGNEAIRKVVESARRPGSGFDPRNEVVPSADGKSYHRVRVIPMAGTQSEDACLITVADVSQQVRADRAREDFVSQVTHELRTPLTNIRAYTETLASGMFEDPKVLSECYNVITKETRRLSRLIEDILNVSQMEVGTLQLHVDDVDLKTLITEAVRDVRGLAEEKNIDLRAMLPPRVDLIKGDHDKLAVVMNNLLGNAIKYTREGGTVTVSCQIKSDEALVSIKDTGIGVAPEDHERIFEKFQRAQDEEVMKQVGTGVGLYTAREIVRRHGGDIGLISKKGEGSTFIVRLPHEGSRASM